MSFNTGISNKRAGMVLLKINDQLKEEIEIKRWYKTLKAIRIIDDNLKNTISTDVFRRR